MVRSVSAFPDVVPSDEEILSAINEYMFGSEHPDLVGYRTQTLQRDMRNKYIYMAGMRRICAIGGLKNKRVLDVGCGFGWQALTISMLGNNSVVAIDILPSMIDGATECVKSLHAKGVKFDVTPLLGDICSLDLPPKSIDAIYSIESIEHVHNLESMQDRCGHAAEARGQNYDLQ
jgi:2-polyprenyl-3-methyl-5-hydroxy-6-metoxy-1,4-benzoquinol methylase